MGKQWKDFSKEQPTKAGYYTVKYSDGTTDEKPYRDRPQSNIKGFMTEKEVKFWK